MKIILSKDIPTEAKNNLKQYGDLLYFNSAGITYTAIANHPDIFMCQINNRLLLAPNTPKEYKYLLRSYNIEFTEGNQLVGEKYPETAYYNAVITSNYLIHNLNATDNKILDACDSLNAINVKQAYTRCNLLPLKNDSFITSDMGIYNALVLKKLNVLLVNPQGIILPGFEYGFFGGACGVYKNSIFITGSLGKFIDGEKVARFLVTLGYEIIELYDGPLFDCGSLILL